MSWLIVIAFLGGIVAVNVLAYRSEARERRQRLQRLDDLLQSRTALTRDECEAEWGEGVSFDVVLRVQRVLARVSDFSLDFREPHAEGEKLRPDDLLCTDLSYEFDSLAFFELLKQLNDEFGLRLKQRDLNAILPPAAAKGPTVRDIVRLVTEKLRAT